MHQTSGIFCERALLNNDGAFGSEMLGANDHRCCSSTPPVRSLRQLSAVLLLSLMHMYNKTLGTEAAALEFDSVCEPDWLKALREGDPALAAVAIRLLLMPSRERQWLSDLTVQKMRAQLWADYAIKHHFDGRLLPGCNNLGCTNLAGVTEAALPTLLCGGCRRVRYCGVACQENAWVAGGHGQVCGKGEWAVP